MDEIAARYLKRAELSGLDREPGERRQTGHRREANNARVDFAPPRQVRRLSFWRGLHRSESLLTPCLLDGEAYAFGPNLLPMSPE